MDVTEAAGVVDRDGRGLGVVAADLDDDGRIDLYVANDGSDTVTVIETDDGDIAGRRSRKLFARRRSALSRLFIERGWWTYPCPPGPWIAP